MPVNYPGENELAATYRTRSSDWLREQLASGQLTPAATASAMAELQLRGEPPSSYGPPPSDLAAAPEHRNSVRGQRDERAAQHRRSWPWWVWLVLFLVGLAYALSQGIKPQAPQDQGLLIGVVVLQALAMVLVIAAFRFFVRARSLAGAFGGLVVLAIPVVALFLLWLLSSLARHPFGG